MLSLLESDSNVIYRINSLADFIPSRNVLRCYSSGKEFSLFAPAARCLLLLIEKQGNIVDKKILMQKGWEEHGICVSPNTYYQNISNIRKTLNNIIPEQDIVTTVKRSGLIIKNSVDIEIVDGKPLQTVSDINDKWQFHHSSAFKQSMAVFISLLSLALSLYFYFLQIL